MSELASSAFFSLTLTVLAFIASALSVALLAAIGIYPDAYQTGRDFVLGSLCGLYLLFLAVQLRGLAGGAAYLAEKGISYAEWARSGFFQMVGVTAVNLTVTMTALTASRREGRAWTVLRLLAALLTLSSRLAAALGGCDCRVVSGALCRVALRVARLGVLNICVRVLRALSRCVFVVILALARRKRKYHRECEQECNNFLHNFSPFIFRQSILCHATIQVYFMFIHLSRE